MDYLPKDPAILVSSVNMLLREGRSPRCITSWRAPEFDTLERFQEDITKAVEILEKML